MIDREQVLHVARLARLELSDEEVGRMSEELSSVLGPHREARRARPRRRRADHPRRGRRTTRCAPTSRTASLPREVALAPAPDVADGGFRVPSPQA